MRLTMADPLRSGRRSKPASWLFLKPNAKKSATVSGAPGGHGPALCRWTSWPPLRFETPVLAVVLGLDAQPRAPLAQRRQRALEFALDQIGLGRRHHAVEQRVRHRLGHGADLAHHAAHRLR